MVKPAYTGSEQDVLNVLANSDAMLSVAGIVNQSKYTKLSVERAIKKLMVKNDIRRVRNGYAYKYTLVNHRANGKRVVSPPPLARDAHKVATVTVEKSDAPRINITAESIFKLMKSFCSGRWTPKNQKLQDNLPYSLAKLYRAAADVFVEGSTVTSSELLDIRRDILEYHQALESAVITIASILEKKELWDVNKFAEFLMSVDANPVTIREITYEAENAQK